MRSLKTNCNLQIANCLFGQGRLRRTIINSEFKSPESGYLVPVAQKTFESVTETCEHTLTTFVVRCLSFDPDTYFYANREPNGNMVFTATRLIDSFAEAVNAVDKKSFNKIYMIKESKMIGVFEYSYQTSKETCIS